MNSGYSKGSMGFPSISGTGLPEWKSMRDLTKDAMLHNVLHSLGGGKNHLTYRVLVLDHRATRVLSSCLRMYNVTEENVALVESLEKKRQPFPDMEAIYIVDPTEESVRMICDDFADKVQYAKAHIFFLQHCDETVFQLIKDSPGLIKRTATLTEINLNYLARMENLFTFDRDSATVDLYNEAKYNYGPCVNEVLDGLVTFCATMNEYPFVRYNANSDLSSMLADEFQKKFNAFVNANTSFWWRGDGGDGHGELSSRATLIMLDRSEDLNVPFLHNFTYYSMINDLLTTHDDLVWYYKGSTQTYHGQDSDPNLILEPMPDPDSDVGVAILNEDDELWKEFRHLHITEVIKRLDSHVKSTMDTTIGKLNKEGTAQAATLEEMNRAIQELPEYQAMMEKHSQHLKITGLCMHKLGKQKLLQIAAVEQAMVTGVTTDAVAANPSTLRSELMELLKDPEIGEIDSARLIALYIITQKGLNDGDRRFMLDSVNPPLSLEIHSSLQNLSYLGSQVQIASPKKKATTTTRTKQELQEAIAYAKSGVNVYSRYKPTIANIVQNICKRRLPEDQYPYVIEPPPMYLDPIPTTSSAGGELSMRTRPKQSASRSAGDQNGNKKGSQRKRNPKGARIIVFIAGGATPSELAAIHDVMTENNRDVVVGTTHIISPKSFIHDLKFLEIAHVKRFFEERAEFEEKKKQAIQKRMNREAASAGLGDMNNPNGDLQEIVDPKPSRKRDFFSCGCLGGPPPPQQQPQQSTAAAAE